VQVEAAGWALFVFPTQKAFKKLFKSDRTPPTNNFFSKRLLAKKKNLYFFFIKKLFVNGVLGGFECSEGRSRAVLSSGFLQASPLNACSVQVYIIFIYMSIIGTSKVFLGNN
jgi:hypothetical protein